MRHPNARYAVGGGVIFSTVVYLVGLAGVAIPEPPLPVAALLGSLASGVVLFIGREGLHAVFPRIWRGESS